MKTLIVDDSKAMRMIIRRTLRQAGYDLELEEASNADEAMQKLQSWGPGLVLCDWNMPGASGLDFLRQVRSAGIRTRFGFITSEASEGMRAEAERMGADFFIAKPFTAESFQENLDPLIRA